MALRISDLALIQCTARDQISGAAARAQRRLANATSDAERRAIQRDALNAARGAHGCRYCFKPGRQIIDDFIQRICIGIQRCGEAGHVI